MRKTKQDNDVTNCICVIYIEIEIELLGPLNQVHMLPKPEKTITWPIVQVRFTPKKKLSYRDQSD